MKKSTMIIWGVVFVFTGFVIFFIVFFGVECLEVKKDYENNPELAREKYGYDSFEQWRLEVATGNYKIYFVPEIGYLRVFP